MAVPNFLYICINTHGKKNTPEYKALHGIQMADKPFVTGTLKRVLLQNSEHPDEISLGSTLFV